MRNRRQYARLFENEGMKHIPAIFKSHLEDILNGTFSAMRWKLSGGGIVRTMDGQTHDVGKWDMLIAHPPCTYLSNAGANRLRIKGIIQKERMKKARRAKAFFLALWEADCPRVAIENPIPGKIHRLPRYTQIVQPYMFGDPWMKTTCLWLRGVPPLFATVLCVPEGKWVETTAHASINAVT